MAADAIWPTLHDSLVRGAHHEMNNRVAALAAVQQVVAMGREVTPELREMLLTELRKMGESVARLGRIPPAAVHRHRDTVLRLSDALTRAVDLIGLHRDSRDHRMELVMEGDSIPLRGDSDALLRALLILLAGAADRQSPGGPPVRIRCYQGEADTIVEVVPVILGEAEHDEIARWVEPFGARVQRDGKLIFPAPPGA